MSAEAMFALYRGETLIDVGTRNELAKRHGVKRQTIQFLNTPAYKKRLKPGHNALHVYRIDEDKADAMRLTISDMTEDIILKTIISVRCPKWISELSLDEKKHIVDECRKKAERAWNDRLDSFGKIYLAKKASEEQGQMSVYDYV